MTTNLVPLRRSIEADGSLLHLVLDRPKANILDAAMIGALRDEIAALRSQPLVRSILLEGAGPHFSYGASVEEHRPAEVALMLRGFHDLFRALSGSGRVLVAAVRGQCLGGGLELAAFCHRVIASSDATLGNPEIKLGVFAPVASIVLPVRVGQARADEMLLTGRSLGAEEALAAGLVDAIAEDPTGAALAWHTTYIAPLSTAAVGHATRAARQAFVRGFEAGIEALERQYLDELMSSHDALEGVEAFLAKRVPRWKHR